MVKRITKEEHIEAEIITARMLSCRAQERDVKKHLAEKFAFSRGQSERTIKAVQRTWFGQLEETKTDILAQMFRTLDEATALAFTKKRPDHVVRSERLRAELAGLLGSEVRLVAPPKENVLDGKSELDVNARAIWDKDFAELTTKECGVLVEVLRERGDHELAAEVEASMMN